MSEASLQQSIIIWFRNNYQMHGKGLIFSVPNEATYKNKIFKNTGVLKGVSDLIVVLPNETIFIELKSLKGSQKDFQLVFQESVTKLGHEYYLIRSLDQFKNELKRKNPII